MDLPQPRYSPEQLAHLEGRRSWRNVANAILMARIGQGLTQEQVGKLAGTKQSRVSDLESMKGNLRFDTLDRIAGALGLMVDIVPRRGAVSRYDDVSGYRQHYAASAPASAQSVPLTLHTVRETKVA